MTTTESWSPDPRLVQAVNDQYHGAIGAYARDLHLITEQANHEESIRVGGYANRTLLELVQNAADAMSGATEDLGEFAGRIEIVLDTTTQTLYCANAGRPFSENGIVAIAHAFLSGKRGDEIGRFGLGFKSVLAVSSTPQVFSRSVSFEFNSPASQAAIAEITSTARRFPILRTPTTLDPITAFSQDDVLADLAQWATTVVRLPHASNIERLRGEIKDFSSEFLLFVSAAREIKLRVLGDDPYETSHVSRDLGGGVLRIENSQGEGEEWVVRDEMHSPSAAAREQVGKAVAREKVKVTVAVPKRQSKQPRGRFWAYFPLQDQTSASGLFNAPWSVNDDRTTLLPNEYNREILSTVSEMFVRILPHVATSTDPAAHLDYMPARGRESLSFGDELLCAHVPRLAGGLALIPDANGTLTTATELRPLDFTLGIPADVQQAWINSPNTGDDVPHWRCYTSPQRVSRLRQLFAAAVSRDFDDGDDRDMKRALAAVRTRGLLSWLREWAEGSDIVSAADALRFVLGTRAVDIERAKVIPTTDGLRALEDRNVVFLHQVEGIEIDGAVFVVPEFLAQRGIEAGLRNAHFRDLDPLAIVKARLARLSGMSDDDELGRLWDAVLGLTTKEAVTALTMHATRVKVPTRDGGWAWPREVLDLDEPLGDEYLSRVLDRTRCVPDVAYQLGVIRKPVSGYALEDELYCDEYRDWALATLNARLGPGDRPIENVEFFPGEGHGPYSVLFMLKDAGASSRLREEWTVQLLEPESATWTCDDLDAKVTYEVQSPSYWAVSRAGLLNSTRGYRAPSEVVAPSLVRYSTLLPLYKGGARHVVDALQLPDELESVPPSLLKEALEADMFAPATDHTVLVELILTASRLAYQATQPPSIPAKVGRAVEPRPPSSVYLATTDEEESYLSSRQRPYLRASESQTEELVRSVGCRRFEDSFAFSMVIEGEQEPERILDVFTGLRGTHAASILANATVTQAIQVAKRVTAEGGVEDQALEYYLDGLNLTVRGDFEEKLVLRFVNEAFDLRFNNADLTAVLKTGLDHRLEVLRQQAQSASGDAERLDVYIGPDDLRDALPKGLWQALETQGLVDSETSVAELFLVVYGSDSIRMLAEQFREQGFPDVPTTWAGMPAAVSWLRKMGFATSFAGRRTERTDHEFVVPGAVKLNPLHDFQRKISSQLSEVLTGVDAQGRPRKAMVELPTGAGKTRVASETVLSLFIDGRLRGPVLWIAQSLELCEQAVQTWSTVWRGLGDERPLTIGRLWEGNTVHEPDTEFSVIVATDAQLDRLLDNPEYQWLRSAAAVIVDEGHRAGGSKLYTRILTWLGVDGRSWERPLVGLSATPFKGKSDGKATTELANRFGGHKIAAFGESAYEQLAGIGVLARVQHEVLPGIEVELQPEEIADVTRQRKVSQRVLDKVGQDQARMATLVKHIMELDPTWPVLVFTPNVLSAQVLAATLRYRGIEAAAVSGQTGRQQRRDVISRFKNDEIRVLANCDLLIQGFDAPGVRALYIARPTFSPSAYIQMAGRGLRGKENGGKDECLIVDLADNFGAASDLLGYREYEDLWGEQRA